MGLSAWDLFMELSQTTNYLRGIQNDKLNPKVAKDKGQRYRLISLKQSGNHWDNTRGEELGCVWGGAPDQRET